MQLFRHQQIPRILVLAFNVKYLSAFSLLWAQFAETWCEQLNVSHFYVSNQNFSLREKIRTKNFLEGKIRLLMRYFFLFFVSWYFHSSVTETKHIIFNDLIIIAGRFWRRSETFLLMHQHDEECFFHVWVFPHRCCCPDDDDDDVTRSRFTPVELDVNGGKSVLEDV